MKKKIIIFLITIFFVLGSFSPIISSLKIKNSNIETKNTDNKNNQNNKENNYYYYLDVDADFSWSPRYPDPGEEIIFTSNSYCYNGCIVSQRWDFGDGHHQYGPTAKYTFKNKGEHRVTLRVQGRGWSFFDEYWYYDWDTDYCTQYIDVGADPFPKFTISNSNPAPGENLTLDGSKSSDPDGKIVSYNWSYYNTEEPEKAIFLGNEEKISYTWNKQGIYNIRLRVEDDKGNSNEVMKTLTISNIKIGNITDNINEINIDILNHGDIDVLNLTCDVKIYSYSMFNFFLKPYNKKINATDIFKSGENEKVLIEDFNGYGSFMITVKAKADNAIEVQKSKFGYVFGEQIFLDEYEINKINRLRLTIGIGLLVTSTILFTRWIVKSINSNSE